MLVMPYSHDQPDNAGGYDDRRGRGAGAEAIQGEAGRAG